MFFQEALSAPYLNLAPLVAFLPVLGLVLNLLVGKRVGERGISLIASLAVIGSFVVAVLLAFSLAGSPEPKTVPFLDWITIGAGGGTITAWTVQGPCNNNRPRSQKSGKTYVNQPPS